MVKASILRRDRRGQVVVDFVPGQEAEVSGGWVLATLRLAFSFLQGDTKLACSFGTHAARPHATRHAPQSPATRHIPTQPYITPWPWSYGLRNQTF